MTDKQQKFFDAPTYFSKTAWLEGGSLIRREIVEKEVKIGEHKRQMIELKGKLVEFQWAIGDWLVMGEEGGLKPKELKEQAIRFTGYAWGTLKNIKSVAGAIEQSRRRDDLSFSCHVEVAKFDSERQERLLDAAVEALSKVREAGPKDMPVREMRKLVERFEKTGTTEKKESEDWPIVRIKVSPAGMSILREIAELRNLKGPRQTISWIMAEYYKDNKEKLKNEREEREKKAEEERADREAKSAALRALWSSLDEAGLAMCREFGLKTRDELAREAGREAYVKAVQEGKQTEVARGEAVRAYNKFSRWVLSPWDLNQPKCEQLKGELFAPVQSSRASAASSPAPAEPEPTASPAPKPSVPPAAAKVRVAASVPRQHWMKDDKLEWLDKTIADNPCDLFLTPAGFVGGTTCRWHVEGIETDDAPVTESWLLDRVGSICRKHNVHIGFGATVLRSDRNSEDFVYFDSDGQILGYHSPNVDCEGAVTPIQMPRLGIKAGTIFAWQVFSGHIWNAYREAKVNLLVHPLEFAAGANDQGMSADSLKWIRKLRFESEFKEVPIACTCNTWDAGEEYLALVGWIEEPTDKTNYFRLPCTAETEKVVVAEYDPAMFNALPDFPFGYASRYDKEVFKALAHKKMMRKAIRLEKSARSGKLAKRTAAAMARRAKEIVPK